jgi:hypothetical protein
MVSEPEAKELNTTVRLFFKVGGSSNKRFPIPTTEKQTRFNERQQNATSLLDKIRLITSILVNYETKGTIISEYSAKERGVVAGNCIEKAIMVGHFAVKTLMFSQNISGYVP